MYNYKNYGLLNKIIEDYLNDMEELPDENTVILHLKSVM